MAIENAKTLNVRIRNKYDSYENWSTSGLVLEAGEIAIAYTSVDVQVENGVAKHPALLMKVGDGTNTFANLPWLSAKAADVAAWAKAANKPTYEAKEITGIGTYIAEYVDKELGISVDTDTQYQIVKVDDYNYKLQSKGKGEETWADVADSVIVIPNDTAAIEALEGLVGTTPVAEQIATYVTNLKLAETYAAKEHEHTKDEITDFEHTHVMADITDLADEFAKKVDKETGKSLVADTEIARLAAMSDGANKVEASTTNGNIKIDGVETTVYTHPDKHAIDDVTGLQDALNGKQDVIAENTYDAYGSAASALDDAKDYTDEKLEALVGTDTVNSQISTALENALKVEQDGTKVEKYALATALAAEAETARAAEKANADAITKLNANAETEGSVDYKIAQKFATLVENPDEAMNSIQELVDWTTEHAADALEMSNQVTANKNAIATLNGDASTAGSVDKKIADAIATENLSQYAKAADLEALDDRVEVVEGLVGKASVEGGDAATGLFARVETAEADIDALEDLVGDTKVATQISNALTVEVDGVKSEKYALATALAATDEEVAKKANDADLKAVAKSGLIDDLSIGEGTVLLFDCGTSIV